MPVSKSPDPPELDEESLQAGSQAHEAEQALEEIEAAVNELVGLDDEPRRDDSAADASTAPPPPDESSASPQAAEESAAPAPPPVVTSASPSLQEIDNSLAEDGDEMIESVFASVEDVLGGSFDEEEAEPASESPAEHDALATDEVRQERAPDAVPVDTARADDASASTDDSTDDEERVAPTGEVDEAPEDDAAPDDAMRQAAAERRSEAPGRGEADAPDQSKGAARRFSAARLWQLARAARPRLLATAASALALLSWPRKFVPEPYRPLMDWIALSLVFWVPVVWVVALFIVGR